MSNIFIKCYLQYCSFECKNVFKFSSTVTKVCVNEKNFNEINVSILDFLRPVNSLKNIHNPKFSQLLRHRYS